MQLVPHGVGAASLLVSFYAKFTLFQQIVSFVLIMQGEAISNAVKCVKLKRAHSCCAYSVGIGGSEARFVR